jgi:hypothetical protein
MPIDAETRQPGYEDVERRAYELYEQRGREDGHDWDDWLAAERELRGSVAESASEMATESAASSARRRRVDQSQRESRGELAQA